MGGKHSQFGGVEEFIQEDAPLDSGMPPTPQMSARSAVYSEPLWSTRSYVSQTSVRSIVVPLEKRGFRRKLSISRMHFELELKRVERTEVHEDIDNVVITGACATVSGSINFSIHTFKGKSFHRNMKVDKVPTSYRWFVVEHDDDDVEAGLMGGKIAAKPPPGLKQHKYVCEDYSMDKDPEEAKLGMQAPPGAGHGSNRDHRWFARVGDEAFQFTGTRDDENKTLTIVYSEPTTCLYLNQVMLVLKENEVTLHAVEEDEEEGTDSKEKGHGGDHRGCHSCLG